MAALYPGTSVSGYNANPPPDDGTTVSTNLIAWNTDVKAKIGDPLNTFASSIDSNVSAGFSKTFDGASATATGISYNATSADQGRMIVATAGGITITTPNPATVLFPFVFGVSNQSGSTITLAGSSSNIDGAASVVMQAGGSCILKTDGSNWFSIGLKPGLSAFLSAANYGIGAPVNLSLATSVGSGVLTVSAKTIAGNTPSASDPILIPFDTGTGTPTYSTITSALSMTTNAIGATLGVANSTPFRLWVVAFYNGGTPVLALWHSGAASPTPTINPLNQSVNVSTTGISAGATSAGVFYTPNGVSIVGARFRILGALNFDSGLATAGNYTSGPSNGILFGPGTKLPGDVLQVVQGSNQTAATASSSTYVQMSNAPAPTITPTSTQSLIELELSSTLDTPGGANSNVSWSRGTTANTNIIGTASFLNVAGGFPLHLRAFDTPATTSSQTYTIQARAAGGALVTVNIQTVTSQQVWTIKEYMA